MALLTQGMPLALGKEERGWLYFFLLILFSDNDGPSFADYVSFVPGC